MSNTKLPKLISINSNNTDNIEHICEDLDLYGTVVVVTGTKTKEILGKHIENLLYRNFRVKEFIVKIGSTDEVKLLENIDSDFLIAVGGGKTIDVTKVVAYKHNVPFLSVPTTASHDGIASNRASLRSFGQHYSMETDSPIGVIANVDIIKNSPYELISAGCGDIIANITAIKDWELSSKKTGESYSQCISSMTMSLIDSIKTYSNDIKSRNDIGITELIRSLILSGISMSFAGSSRPCSGFEHMFSHAMDQLNSKCFHGHQVAVGALISSYLHDIDWMSIRDLLTFLNIPKNYKELGLSKNLIKKALVLSREIRSDRYTILNEKKDDELIIAAEKTGVI